MRALSMVLLAALVACPKAENPEQKSNTPTAPAPQATGLVLVEAELATRMQNGRLSEDEFCEAQVPILELRGSTLEMQCGQEGDLWSVAEETSEGAKRVLKTKAGKRLEIEEMGRQRYRVSGSVCDKKPTFYVLYPEAKSFRDKWLRSAACPTEDMKVAP